MNVSDFIAILQHSNTILSPKQTRELEDILHEYPYFQAARALHLKGLKNLESYKYNNALKLTAAHTTDREVLFDLITSDEFTQNNIADSLLGRSPKLEEKQAVSEEIEPNPEAQVILGETEAEPLPQNIKDAEQILDPALFETTEPDEEAKIEEGNTDTQTPDGLNLGKPLPFTKSERHSFSEWLQLTSFKPIERKVETSEEPAKQALDKKKKFELLDKFIESRPKIVPSEEKTTKVAIKESVKFDKTELMTETLAKVYLEQKKYKKAIQSYKILSLKYPEKSGFFADRIREVKQLQKDND
ncbi:hypothetical protein ABV409_06570 [Flagellimonas sp. DF-77]|uniref:hypothetical protein n=1 Tax=Flagellimonas algarum TaxID=3230298 RepID=UPI0033917686